MGRTSTSVHRFVRVSAGHSEPSGQLQPSLSFLSVQVLARRALAQGHIQKCSSWSYGCGCHDNGMSSLYVCIPLLYDNA